LGYDASIPLSKDPTYGFAELTTARQAVQQQMKNLLLTSPGERVMLPDFGVGLKRYLFENLDRSVLGSIETRIRKQVAKYLPYVNLKSVTFESALDSGINSVVTDFDENRISIKISYSFGRGFFDEIIVTP
jgi:phage baseplate assembly protein W